MIAVHDRAEHGLVRDGLPLVMTTRQTIVIAVRGRVGYDPVLGHARLALMIAVHDRGVQVSDDSTKGMSKLSKSKHQMTYLAAQVCASKQPHAVACSGVR